MSAHQLRVGELAAARAEAMGLSGGEVGLARIAGCLHDCGKIDPEIIPWVRSKDKFNPMDTPLVNHPSIGAGMVRDQFGAGVADLVAGHHPHYSGSTYGAASPVQQSIIEADIWDALREARSYKDIASVDLSRTILVNKHGVSESAADWWATIGDDLASDLKFYFFVRN